MHYLFLTRFTGSPSCSTTSVSYCQMCMWYGADNATGRRIPNIKERMIHGSSASPLPSFHNLRTDAPSLEPISEHSLVSRRRTMTNCNVTHDACVRNYSNINPLPLLARR